MPKRGVVEGDLGAWKFRRFQEVLDVEVWVDGNRAEAYSASYITADAEKRGRINDADLVNVFVTRYRAPDGVVRATVKLARRLAADGGYQVEEDKVAGARVLSIIGHGEAWMMWPSDKHVVKVGGRGRSDVPKAMVESYVDRYPSLLPGGALEGALPPGPEDAPKPVAKPGYDANNPQPDAEHYDPNKVKLPDHKDDPDAAPASDAPADDAASKPAPAAKKKKKKPASN
ncbi:MAG TPA: hypothetical protein VFP84_19335 [Kofleriaceae bacterium]|nr:hypothetical protein [Kofleriaceae bacterium]